MRFACHSGHRLAVAVMTPVMVAPGATDIAFVALRRHVPRFAVSIVAPADRPASPAARAFVAMARRHAAT
jgi:DNA-binding transcriptional LysR family regulator